MQDISVGKLQFTVPDGWSPKPRASLRTRIVRTARLVVVELVGGILVGGMIALPVLFESVVGALWTWLMFGGGMAIWLRVSSILQPEACYDGPNGEHVWVNVYGLRKPDDEPFTLDSFLDSHSHVTTTNVNNGRLDTAAGDAFWLLYEEPSREDGTVRRFIDCEVRPADCELKCLCSFAFDNPDQALDSLPVCLAIASSIRPAAAWKSTKSK